MSQLLLWATDEVQQVPIKEFMKIVLPKSWTDQRPKDEIYTKICTVCGLQTDGFPCGSEECPQ